MPISALCGDGRIFDQLEGLVPINAPGSCEQAGSGRRCATRFPARRGGTRWTPGSRAQPVSPKAAARPSTAPALRRGAPGRPRTRSAAPAPAKRDACTWGMGTATEANRAQIEARTAKIPRKKNGPKWGQSARGHRTGGPAGRQVGAGGGTSRGGLA